MQRLAITLVTCLLTLAFADTADAGLGIGARYSHVHNNDLEDNSSMFGAMVRLRHMMILGFEGAIDVRKEEMNDGSELRSTPITVSVMVYPIPVVYGLVGLGLYSTTLDVEGDTFDDRTIGYHFGGGVEMPLIPLLKLTGDMRYQFVNYSYTVPYAGFDGDIEANGYAISAGLILYLK